MDIVVVHKVDRLIRSRFDFASLVETHRGVRPVAQSFNSTTSMGG